MERQRNLRLAGGTQLPSAGANEILRPDTELIKRHCVRQYTHGTDQKISPL